MFSQVASQLRSRKIETQFAFEPRALPSYIAILIGIILTCSLAWFGGFRFTDRLMLIPPAWSATFVVGGIILRRYGHPTVAGGCESIGLIYSQSLLILSCLPMLTAFSAPFADDLLARAYRAIGFDWQTYISLFEGNHTALRAACFFYMSFMWEAAVILIALFATRRSERAWQFVNAAAIALLVTVAIYPFAPAVGAVVHFGITPKELALPTGTPWSFAPAITAMKTGTRLITSSLMVGYVSFPSYHAASAVMFTWAAWSLGRVRWLILGVNLLMAASAMVVGAHYFVDLLGGAAVASASLWLASRLTSRSIPDQSATAA